MTRIDTKKRCVSQYFKEEIGGICFSCFPNSHPPFLIFFFSDKLGVNFRFSFPEENERDGISVAKLYQLSDTDQVPSRFGPGFLTISFLSFLLFLLTFFSKSGILQSKMWKGSRKPHLNSWKKLS